jgi:hypothetical protein
MRDTNASRGAIGIVLILATCAQARAQAGNPAAPKPDAAVTAPAPALPVPAHAPPPAQAPAPPPAQAQAPAAPSSVPAPAGTPALVVDQQTMDTVTGKKVRSAAGEDLGRLIDVMVDSTGQVRAAIIDFGGVLGVGSRKVAVEWSALDFKQAAKTGNIILTLTRDQIRTAPEYRPGEPAVILQRPKSPEAPPAPDSSHR